MSEKIDVNKADVETLASLPGIGPKRAEQIVEYRTAVHPFEEIIELAAVPGISERMVREFETQLMVVDGAETEEAVGSEEAESTAVSEEITEQAELENGEEKSAEPQPETMTGETEPEAPAQEEPPVVVMMLDDEPPERPEPNEEPEPEPEMDAETAAPPPAPAEVEDRRVVETVQRRHTHFWQQLLGVLLGAVGGSLLTLLLLYLLNGTLRFAGENQATSLQLQLDEESSAIRQSQSDMTEEMGQLAGRVTELDNDLASSDEAIGAVEVDVTSLEEETAAINERLETIDLAAEKFETFLTGMRDLLFALQGAPAPTATITGTATITVTLTPEETAEPLQTTPTPTPTTETPEAGPPTRTPRPTATPLIENE